MFKKVLGAGLGAVLMIAAVGCDEETLAKSLQEPRKCSRPDRVMAWATR